LQKGQFIFPRKRFARHKIPPQVYLKSYCCEIFYCAPCENQIEAPAENGVSRTVHVFCCILLFNYLRTPLKNLLNSSGVVRYFSATCLFTSASLCGSVDKDCVCHACGHEFDSRLEGKFSNVPHHL